ncbi:hypothetical protein G6F57_015257 [Rhizopus arrhizus]|nr:hypothetical protein G6F57_015257 [Rhizopus arrhizus]
MAFTALQELAGRPVQATAGMRADVQEGTHLHAVAIQQHRLGIAIDHRFDLGKRAIGNGIKGDQGSSGSHGEGSDSKATLSHACSGDWLQDEHKSLIRNKHRLYLTSFSLNDSGASRYSVFADPSLSSRHVQSRIRLQPVPHPVRAAQAAPSVGARCRGPARPGDPGRDGVHRRVRRCGDDSGRPGVEAAGCTQAGHRPSGRSDRGRGRVPCGAQAGVAGLALIHAFRAR